MNTVNDVPTTSVDIVSGGAIHASLGGDEGGEGNHVAISDPYFPDNWNDLLKQEEPLDWDAFHKSEVLLQQRSNLETLAILNRISGSISVIASAMLVIHILRSPEGLSTTYHRLMFGISITDILFSSALCLGSLMVPKELDYMIPGAQGNAGTCAFQGFLLFAGWYMPAYYNCSICFYYLAIIKYNKSDAYIAKKLERWFHGVPITVTILAGFLLVAIKSVNAIGQFCFVTPYNPPHCIGIEDGERIEGYSIPCGRGNAAFSKIYLIGIYFALLFSPPTIIVTTMVMMYRTVLKIERNVARYGVGTLRLNVQKYRERGVVVNESNSETTSTTLHTKIMKKIQSCITYWSQSLRNLLTIYRYSNNDGDPGAADAVVVRRRRSSTGTKSKKKRVSRKQSILQQMASGYVMAWVIIWIPALVALQIRRFEVTIISGLLNPLQGLFNFMVFMSPKVRAAKNPRIRRGMGKQPEGNVSWFKACFDAYMLTRPRRRRERTTMNSSI